MTADLGIIHSATMWLDLHGDNAIPEARRMAAEIHGKGDLDGADTRLKISAACELNVIGFVLHSAFRTPLSAQTISQNENAAPRRDHDNCGDPSQDE